MTKQVILERDGAVARIILNLPAAMNAIGPEMACDLDAATAEVAQDDAIRCVIVTGAGAHFMAGGDIRYFAQTLQQPAEDRDAKFSRLISDVGNAVTRLRTMSKPVIGVVRGAVAGFGFSLMCACDLVLASQTTICKLAYCQLGASPDGGGSYTLPRLVGLRQAMEIALIDEPINAERAREIGLVNRVFADTALDSASLEMAQRLARQATTALGRTKRLIHASFETDLASQLEAERLSFLAGLNSEDFSEAVAAFTNKRKPSFSGR